MQGKIIKGLLIVLLSASAAMAADSVYTDFSYDDKNCKPVGPQPEDSDGEGEVGAVTLSCPGLGGYQVLLKEGDGRASMHYGYLGKAIVDNTWESFGPFNSVAGKVEWRRDEAGRPFAAIQRFRIENLNPETMEPDQANRGNVLVVSRVGQKDDQSGCVVGLVDAQSNKDANEIARKVADELAAGFRCGKDKALYHGKRGPNAADLEAYFE